MNFEYFIAKRIVSAKEYKNSISSPIIKIAILSIVIGFVTMLISIASGVGLQNKIYQKVSAFNGDIIISNFDTNFSDDSQNPISTIQGFYPTFNSIEGIQHIQATASKGGVIRTANKFEGVVVKGVGKDYDWNYFNEFLIDGSLPDYSQLLTNKILISEYTSNRLNLNVGDKLNTFFFNSDNSKLPRSRSFEVSGVYNSGFNEFDEKFVIADIRHIQRLNKWSENEIGSYEVFVEEFSKIDQIGNEVYNEVGSFLDSQTIKERYFSIFKWLELFDFNIILIIIIMIVVAGINMITALLVLILERTQMIGIIKALGSSNKSIRKIFIYNAMYLLGIGLFWGNVIGIGLLLIQKYFKLIKLDPAIYYVTEAPVYIAIDYILLLNVGTLIVCFSMLLIPSYIISKITPVRAIRFE
ncbi:ABC transporter permease [Flavobacteriaceae bacterium]|nr:ABC transporter permease [Flavobacteriaceae bacterium]